MAWPLTGNALAKYNRLLSDLRQYGDMYFVGSPDDITYLYEVIRAISDGALTPSLEDVANRSHYWMLRIIALLGDQTAMPKPETPCPPCPPDQQNGFQWGPDPTTIDVSINVNNGLDLSFIGFRDPTVTTIIFPSLESVTGGGIYGDTMGDSVQSFSAPRLVSVDGNLDISLNSPTAQFDTFSAPLLETVAKGVNLCCNPLLTTVNLDGLVTVGGDFSVFVELPLITSALLPNLVSIGATSGGTFYVQLCPSLTSVSAPVLQNSDGISFGDCPLVTSISFPALTSIGEDGFEIFSSLGLVSIDLPLLSIDANSFDMADTSLTSLSLPALVSAGSILLSGRSLRIDNNALLVDVSLPVYLPPDGTSVSFIGCALSAASVNHILARAVANAGYVSGVIDTSGGANAAPTGQGIADKATLQARGVTVNTN